MTFLEALKTGKPMRRKSQVIKTTGYDHLGWRWLGRTHSPLGLGTAIVSSYVAPSMTAWLLMDTGAPCPMERADYLADDWEVM